MDFRHPTANPSKQPRLRIGALVAAIAALTGCGQPPVQNGADHVPDSNVAIAAAKDGKFATMAWPMVDGLMNSVLDGAFAPGCAVGVSIDDEIVYLQGYGRSRLGLSAQDWSVSTMGAVGSVSKTFTALAAMRQIESGWATLNTQVADHSPANGALGNAVLAQLLSHTSGVGGPDRGAAFSPNWDAGSTMDQCKNAITPDPADPFCTEVHRASLDPQWMLFSYVNNETTNVVNLPTVDFDGDGSADGWQAIYSNVGYSVAGAMVDDIAKAHGYSGYEHYVWDEVGTWSANPLAPGQATSLAITHAHRADDIPNRAVGYYDGNWGAGAKNWVQGEAWEVTEAQASWFGPSGGWSLTIGDFMRLLVAYRDEKIVNRHWMETRFGHLALGPDPMNLPPNGLGLFLDDANGSIYNGGDIGIAQGNQRQSVHGAIWSLWPNAVNNQDVGVGMICNNGRGSGWIYSRAKDIVEELQDDPDSRPFSTQTHTTSPHPQRIDGRHYEIDHSAAYVLQPAGFPILPSAANAVRMQPNLRTGKVLLSDADGAFSGVLDSVKLDRRGRLQASRGWMQLGVGAADIDADQLSISFQVADDGSQLYDGRIQSMVDARNLAQQQLTPSAALVCDAVEASGAGCLPCDDGQRYCFLTELGGVRATLSR